MRDVIIIGAGPAGMGAAVYGKRAGLDALVLESSGFGGGQVTTTYEVDNYLGLAGISGMELAERFSDHGEKMGVETETGNVVSVEPQPGGFLLKTEEKTYETRTIILAAGASHNHLNVPGEEELAGMGVSYCATCDGAFFRGKTTVVVGGGDVAVEDALFLARGCEKVYLVHRRDKLRAAKMLQDSLFAQPNIEVCFNSTVEKILGGDMVEGVLLHNKETGQSSELPVQGVFIAVGIHPNTEPFAALVDTDENGYIIAGEDAVTSCPGIFAAGDIRTKALRQIITAVADGANAINSVEKYLLNL